MKKVSIILIAAATIILLGAAGFLGYMYNNTKQWTNLIYPKVKIENIDLSDKSIEDAKQIISEKYNDVILKKIINIKTPNKTYTLDYTKLNAKFNIDDTVKQAFDYGKNESMFEKYKLINNPEEKNFKMKFYFETKAVDDLVSIIKNDVNKTAVDGKLSFSGGKFSVSSDIKGAKLDEAALKADIISKIDSDITKAVITVSAPIQEIQPQVTKEKLQGVNTKISAFSTDYSSSDFSRSTNIELATKSINGKLLMPGDSFSFNETVGQRTEARGYQVAPVIIGTKVNADYGGGICQVSTTLYNAVIRANIESTERTHHTLPSHYIGPAMDATVDWGNLDYKFKNTLAFPVYIEAFTASRKIYFTVYSDSSLTKRKYDLVNEVYATIEPKTKFVDDPTLPIGQTVQDQPPSLGIKAKAFKDTYENGKLIEHKQISNDFYQPVDEVIKKGTKKQ